MAATNSSDGASNNDDIAEHCDARLQQCGNGAAWRNWRATAASAARACGSLV